MKLKLEELKDSSVWESAGIELPKYDIEKVRQKTIEAPCWAHFGIGNIFRIFIGKIADKLLDDGDMDTGLTCIETFDYEVVDRIYTPYDNLALAVTLYPDGRIGKRVHGCLCEAVKADKSQPDSWNRLKEIFTADSLQMITFTITEKGYNLKDSEGKYFAQVESDLSAGPDAENLHHALTIVAAMLWERFKAGGTPLALVSVDNVSQNGKKFRESVLDIVFKWQEKGFVSEEFFEYVNNPEKVSFPWSMIDKIVPRPSDKVLQVLKNDGIEDMDIVITQKKTYIAPFVNGEDPQYLVIEDSFPNGRPPLEKAGVYMTDRDTVNAAERMKVTVCLNPIHTALAPLGCALGFVLFSDEMHNPQLAALADLVGRKEGMHVVKNPGILSPEAFIDECINERFPNPYLGDTPQRIAVDTSQMVGIRFGETIKEYVARYGDAKKLIGIPLAIAGWLRYMLAVDDEGNAFELSPDPMNREIQSMLKGIHIGDAESFRNQLRPILSNVHIFGIDLYEAGIGSTIEKMFKEMIAETGAIRSTLMIYLS